MTQASVTLHNAYKKDYDANSRVSESSNQANSVHALSLVLFFSIDLGSYSMSSTDLSHPPLHQFSSEGVGLPSPSSSMTEY